MSAARFKMSRSMRTRSSSRRASHRRPTPLIPAQPRTQQPARQECDRSASFQVTDDRAVSEIAAPSTVIDADHARRWWRWPAMPAHDPKQRIVADRDHEPSGKAGCRTIAQRQDDELHCPTTNRQIHQSPMITAMNARSRRAASWAGARPAHCTNDHHGHSPARIDALNRKSRRDERRATEVFHGVDSSRESVPMKVPDYIKTESEPKLRAEEQCGRRVLWWTRLSISTKWGSRSISVRVG